MKKFLLMALALLLASCATTNVKTYPHLTFDEVKDKCEPDQEWSMNVLGLSSYVAVSQDCLNFKRLFIIRMDSSFFTEDVRNSTVEVLRAHFIHFADERGAFDDKELQPGMVKWALKKLKTEVDTEEGTITYFFDLTYKKIKPECSDGVCKRIK